MGAQIEFKTCNENIIPDVIGFIGFLAKVIVCIIKGFNIGKTHNKLFLKKAMNIFNACGVSC
jgi:hypothetical protein